MDQYIPPVGAKRIFWYREENRAEYVEWNGTKWIVLKNLTPNPAGGSFVTDHPNVTYDRAMKGIK